MSDKEDEEEKKPQLNYHALKSMQGHDLMVVSHAIQERNLEAMNRLTYKKVKIDDPYEEVTEDFQNICGKLQKCIDMRRKYMRISCQEDGMNPKDEGNYMYDPVNEGHPLGLPLPKFNNDNLSLHCVHGVYQVKGFAQNEESVLPPTLEEFTNDLDSIISMASEGPIKTFTFKRLQYLQSLFEMHLTLNELEEHAVCRTVPHRDFYNIRKVDTHVHHSACMNQKHLLRFIKSKLKKNPNDVVIFRDGKHLTLAEVFKSLHVTAYDLSIDALDMHAHKDSFQRFDKFNLKYNPVGESRLREIFLKTDNYIKGRYLADLTKEVISDLEDSKYQMAEYRISIYGRNMDEWYKLADWFCENQVFSKNVRWLIQVPRLYHVYKEGGQINNFQEFLSNIFKPLFEVSINPEHHPNLFRFLFHLAGFDSVDDESKATKRMSRAYPTPEQWNSTVEPPYAYYLFYMFSNITTLNQLRKSRNLNTFTLRPHAGEAGSEPHDNLTTTFLLSHSINHGILLRKVPALQYLYYLEQIGLAMSPLSNNSLFLTYDRNPFPDYFKRGLNISISTDDPLQFHFTKEPLIEEYSVAAQIWKLSPTDMCEIGRNSVIQCGFELPLKKTWIGENCRVPGPQGNDIQKTNVPNIRLAFRHDTLTNERNLIQRGLKEGQKRGQDQIGILKRKVNDVILLNMVTSSKKPRDEMEPEGMEITDSQG